MSLSRGDPALPREKRGLWRRVRSQRSQSQKGSLADGASRPTEGGSSQAERDRDGGRAE